MKFDISQALIRYSTYTQKVEDLHLFLILHLFGKRVVWITDFTKRQMLVLGTLIPNFFLIQEYYLPQLLDKFLSQAYNAVSNNAVFFLIFA